MHDARSVGGPGAAAMQYAAVVPDHDVARRPAVGEDARRPAGFVEQDGQQLPVGLQLLAKPFDEASILRTAYAYEQATNWHTARPEV